MFCTNEEVSKLSIIIGEQMMIDRKKIVELSKLVEKCMDEIKQLKEINKDIEDKYNKLLMASL